MTTISILAIDIAKITLQLHGADHTGNAVIRKRLSRHQLAAYVANLAPCTVVMGVCGGANYWAGVFQRSGHTAKLISPYLSHPSSLHLQGSDEGSNAKRIASCINFLTVTKGLCGFYSTNY